MPTPKALRTGTAEPIGIYQTVLPFRPPAPPDTGFSEAYSVISPVYLAMSALRAARSMTSPLELTEPLTPAAPDDWLIDVPPADVRLPPAVCDEPPPTTLWLPHAVVMSRTVARHAVTGARRKPRDCWERYGIVGFLFASVGAGPRDCGPVESSGAQYHPRVFIQRRTGKNSSRQVRNRCDR